MSSVIKNFYNLMFVLVCLFLSGCAWAFNPDQWLEQKIQVKDGLPDSTVFSIQQDQNGYMWFGTTNGLARYDGYTFKVFKHDGANSDSLANNNAGNIYIDSANKLWIGSFGGGVNTLNLKTGVLKKYPYSSQHSDKMLSENVQTFYQDSDANMWIGTNTGMYKLIDEELTHYQHLENKNSLINSRVWDIDGDEQGNIWIGTSAGLSQLDSKTGHFNNYKLSENLVIDVSSNQFRKLYLSDNTLWIGSSTGLYSFSLAKKTIYSTQSD